MTPIMVYCVDEWASEGGGRRLYLTFDGENWVMFDLSLLPDDYHHLNTRETVELTFQTNGPNGLIWFSGNERDNVQLSLRVSWLSVRCSVGWFVTNIDVNVVYLYISMVTIAGRSQIVHWVTGCVCG